MLNANPLTKNQAGRLYMELVLCKKHWSNKKIHAIKLIKPYQKDITEEDLQWYIEKYIPSEVKRHKVEYFNKSQKGLINIKYTPTDVANKKFNTPFSEINRSHIGGKYHLSWAFKAAVFVLKRIEGEYGWVDNPKHKREQLLKIKLSDLRKLR